eukprot:scaffold211001_cov62-Attheya_sp.AAC.2
MKQPKKGGRQGVLRQTLDYQYMMLYRTWLLLRTDDTYKFMHDSLSSRIFFAITRCCRAKSV